MDVEHVDLVSVPTRDAARARRFYVDLLGLPPSTRAQDEVEAPNVTLGSFKDPDGNVLILHRRYAAPGSTKPVS